MLLRESEDELRRESEEANLHYNSDKHTEDEKLSIALIDQRIDMPLLMGIEFAALALYNLNY